MLLLIFDLYAFSRLFQCASGQSADGERVVKVVAALYLTKHSSSPGPDAITDFSLVFLSPLERKQIL